jgi:hypothetical protein
MDGTRWIPNGWQLHIENMTDVELQRKHLAALNELVMRMDWPTVNPDHPLQIKVDRLGSEIRIRMAAE